MDNADVSFLDDLLTKYLLFRDPNLTLTRLKKDTREQDQKEEAWAGDPATFRANTEPDDKFSKSL